MRKNYTSLQLPHWKGVLPIPSFRKFVLLFIFLSSSLVTLAQKEGKLEVTNGVLVKSIASLKNLRPDPNFKPRVTRDETGLLANKKVNPVSREYGSSAPADPVVQREAATSVSAPTVIEQNYDGMGFDPVAPVAPADPTLSTGNNHVIQMINGRQGSYIKIWDKAGNVALAQTYMFQLFAVPGYSGAGDPVALYDQFSDRYFITEFGFSAGVTTFVNTLIVGVSETNDPTGAWNVYKYVDNSFFVDYPHWGVWPNAIYATSNDFNTAGTAYLGSSVYAFDKDAMLAGSPTAAMQRQRFSNTDFVYISMAPVSISGSTPPAAGSPGLFVYYSDDNFTAEPADVDFLQLITFQPDFVTPENTVIALEETINTASFKSRICGFARNCIPSAGGSYDAISDRIMNRIYYRNFGTHEALVLNYTVDANFPAAPRKAGLRWYELRKSGGPWSIFQQSTYAPDTDHRWMGTIGINSLGQIGLGYNHSGPTKFASIYFSGRNAGDPINTLTTGERLVVQGTGFGTFSNRWGDYNDMATDKTNDVTFWMTAMYGITGQWRTRVASFNIGDPCPTITVSPATLPNFTFNQPYSATLSASGDIPPYTFIISSGALPPGLTLNATTGVISGTSNGTNASYTFTVTAADGGGCVGTRVYTLTNNTSFVTTAFCNTAAITIPGSGVANPYPSNVTVSGISSPIVKVTVSLNGFTHTWPSDVDILLVGPGGQRAIILSDVGGGNAITDVNLTLDDGAPASLTAARITSGIYKPTNIGASDPFPAPAPGTTANSALSVFDDVSPNGQWNLYVLDDEAPDAGTFSGGWCVNFTMLEEAPQITCPSNITVTAAAGECAVSVDLSGENAATATGNPSPTIAYSVAGSPITSPHVFTEGTTTVTATASNGVVPDATCTFTVTVIAPVTNAIIPDAFALPSGVAANTVYIGYAPASSITLTAQPVGGTPPYTYLWSTGATTQSITVSPTVTTVYSVTITTSGGCFQTASKQINVVDVRCGNKLNKVVICHVPPGNPANSKTKCINGSDVADHLAHGNYLGACNSNNVTTRAVKSFTLENVDVAPDRLIVQTSPNPTSKSFTLSIRSKNTQPVQISIIDNLGKLVEAKSNVPANGTLQVGQHYRSGTYYALIIQGTERITVKLVKIAQ